MTVRELRSEDLQNGFLESLGALPAAGDLDESRAGEIFEEIRADGNHIIVVAELDGRIVGCATILIEQKFIHGGGRAAHIEDVAVSRENQGAGIGRRVVLYALERARESGCYKTVLECTDTVMPFYEKIGFRRNANALRFDHGSM